MILAERERLLADLVRRAEALRASVLERGADGEFVVSGALRRDLNAEYDELRESRIPEAELAVEYAAAAVAAAPDRTELPGLETLLPIVASVQDPVAMEFRDLLRAGLCDLVVTSEEFTEVGLAGRKLTLSGRLELGVGGERLSMSAHVEWVDGDASRIADRVDDIVSQMAEGVPFADTRGPWRSQLLPAVNEALGRPDGTRLTSCREPRLLRLAVLATALHPDLSAEELEESFGEPAALFRRLRVVYSPENCVHGKWCQHAAGVLPQMLDVAFVNDGLVRYVDAIPEFAGSRQALSAVILHYGLHRLFEVVPNIGYRLVARCVCAPDRTPHLGVMRIKEPDGLVCRSCGRDRSGIVWPLEVYGEFLSDATPVVRRSDDAKRRVAPVEVRCWAVEEGLVQPAKGGKLPNFVVEAWNVAHPDRPYRRVRGDWDDTRPCPGGLLPADPEAGRSSPRPRPTPPLAGPLAGEVREWAHAHGLARGNYKGMLSNAVVYAWNDAHPDRPYRRQPVEPNPRLTATSAVVRQWAATQPDLHVTPAGKLQRSVIRAWNEAHPGRPYVGGSRTW
jgi:hypothetical protein